MSKAYFIVVDIGTQSLRTALIDDSLNILEIYNLPQKLNVISEDNRMEIDVPFMWEGTLTGIQRVVKNSGVSPQYIKGICTGAIMHVPIPIDRNGMLLSNYVQIYSDKRCREFVEAFCSSKDQDKAYQLTANIPMTSWMGFKIRWVKEYQPEIYEQTWKFLPANAYVNYKLTGVAKMDYAEASGTYLYSCIDNRWSTWLAEKVGCRAILLNPATEPWSVINDYLGLQPIGNTNRFIEVKPEFADELRQMNCERIHPERYLVFLSTHDEVLDWHKAKSKYAACRQILLPGNTHEIDHFEQCLPEIQHFFAEVPQKRTI